MEQDEFFVIEVTKKDRSRGFIVEYPDGIHISDQPIADMKQFFSYHDAREFIKRYHLERGGVKADIISNKSLIIAKDDYKTTKEAPMVYYTVINGVGQRIFFDAGQDGYYFKDGEVGSCVWKDEESANLFIKVMGLPPDVTSKRLVQGMTTDQKN